MPEEPQIESKSRSDATASVAAGQDARTGQGERAARFETTRPDSSGDLDPQLVQETRLQIRGLVQEIAELVQSECELNEFLQGFVSRLTSALASVGAAVWMRSSDGHLQLAYRANLPEEIQGDAAGARPHALLLQRLLETGEPSLVPPHSAADNGSEAANPTPYLLVLAPLKLGQERLGLVEVFQRAGTGPTTQRGYLRFLVQMADLSSDYFKSQRLLGFHEQEQLWGKLEQFIRSIHQSLDLQETAYQLANEGRRVLDCDRLTVATHHRHRLRIQAVSGLDAVDRRAADLKLLQRITSLVISTREPFWYGGDLRDVPPQIEKHLQPYLDRTHCKWLGIIPIQPQLDEDATGERKDRERDTQEDQQPLGALIIEQLSDTQKAPRLASRGVVIAQHAADALGNVRTYAEIPFAGLWKSLARVSWLWQWRNLPFSITVTAIVVAVVVSLCVVPADFELGADGSLTPARVRHVFAPIDGTVAELAFPANPQQPIEAGVPLIRLENRALETKLSELEGNAQRLELRRDALKRSLLENNSKLEAAERIQLESDIDEAEQSLATVRRDYAIHQQKMADLVIRCPSRGIIGDWQAQTRLQRRPVRLGQRLLTIVDPEGPWELELEVPEEQVGHLVSAQHASQEPLQVTFIVASDPASKFRGQIREIHPAAEVRGSDQNVVLVRVAFDKQQIPTELLRYGTRVQGRIDCGQQPMGYVLFHDVIESVHKRILFWF